MTEITPPTPSKNNDFDRLNYIESRVKSDGKNQAIAWVLWFFLGAFSGHRLYLGQKFSVLMLVCVLATWILLATFFLAILAPIPAIISLVLWIKDAMQISTWTTEANEAVRTKVLNDLGQ